MPVERPTFSESWYRVANLTPRLRSTSQVHRQHYRGQLWYVIEDPSNNQFFRTTAPAYQFVAMLDGRRKVSDVWRICNERIGDAAPTQVEAIQLLGQLYASNLLDAQLPGDAESLFRRYRKRVRREVQGYLTNLLFVRIPLLDPDHFLDRWVGVFGKFFSWYGAVLWVAIIAAGLYHLAGRAGELADRASAILQPGNLPLLYLSLVAVKVCHEFGHCFACKRFGRLEGGTGQVHVLGVMFLVFTPMPYMDASSAWAFRSKWRKVIVGAAGMIVELAIAAIAAIVWSKTRQGTTIHAICYNIMFIASVSSVLFNGNPLLRYDAYYILSDLLEIPNLAPRSKQYLYYLVKRFIWRVRQLRNPAHIWGEQLWFVFYGIASTLYRVFILVMILLFLSDKLPKQLMAIAVALGVVSGVIWLCVPIGKFVRYLATSGELGRVRSRAVASTLLFVAAVVVGLGLIPAPDRCRVEGVVEPLKLEVVHAGEDGIVVASIPSGHSVGPAANGAPLVLIENPELAATREQRLAELTRLNALKRQADMQDPATAYIIAEYIETITDQIRRLDERLDSLAVRTKITGEWISPDIDRLQGAYVQRGQKLGWVASPDRVIIRATAGQDLATLVETANPAVEIRAWGRPEKTFSGWIDWILPVGHKQLPSAALGYAGGGAVRTSPQDRAGTVAAERFFEIRITPTLHPRDARLWSGQRVVVRCEMPMKPLAVQWWRSFLQLLQRRFQI